MLSIRLTRKGRKRKPFYRIVVAEKTAPRDGRFVEIVGYYNPIPDPDVIVLKKDRISYWIQKGAQPTETVRKLIARARRREKSQEENNN